MGDFAKLKVARELPPAGRYTDRATALFQMLAGARIIECGAPDDDDAKIEGGGLIIDFVPAGAAEPRRVVFGFNESGMWVEYDGPLNLSSPSSGE